MVLWVCAYFEQQQIFHGHVIFQGLFSAPPPVKQSTSGRQNMFIVTRSSHFTELCKSDPTQLDYHYQYWTKFPFSFIVWVVIFFPSEEHERHIAHLDIISPFCGYGYIWLNFSSQNQHSWNLECILPHRTLVDRMYHCKIGVIFLAVIIQLAEEMDTHSFGQHHAVTILTTVSSWISCIVR